MSTRSSRDLMPPFAWIDIPAGKVTLEAGGYVPEGGQTFDVAAFCIAKYPMTNSQYAKFIEAGGYTEKQWWTEVGWDEREMYEWMEPRFWQDEHLNVPDHPVVSVSWHEALAFCRWLSAVTGENITLPTEQQWQQAAQGDDKHLYPWGNEWDASRCTHNPVRFSGSYHTTPVTQHEGKGDSPFGVVDMVGNVSEWCLTGSSGKDHLDSRSEMRMLRSATVSDKPENLRATFRISNFPHTRYGDYGFRLARLP